MKVGNLLSNTIFGILLIYLLPSFLYGQSIDDPNEVFVPIRDFEAVRGSFNISYCVKFVMNCWVILRPEMFCDQNSHMHVGSICDTLKNRCTDQVGIHRWWDYWAINKERCTYYLYDLFVTK